ncbi:hypothetical protein HYALB_00000895 [Hymenoscyphus albidus]|uniref:Uncharacterized protein n=1 Tax=Hymenoscyphus albidus TaxID=595503 RepID=A0A9N9LEA1_9HELO|nr:hypothetical protein HYALB_00000895 [Hymenoscyphus albidus]
MSTTRPNESVLSIISSCIFSCFTRDTESHVAPSNPQNHGHATKGQTHPTEKLVDPMNVKAIELGTAASILENAKIDRQKFMIEFEPALKANVTASALLIKNPRLQAGEKSMNKMYEELMSGHMELEALEIRKKVWTIRKEKLRNGNKEGVNT